MPEADSTLVLPVGAGWLRAMDANGTYTIQSQTTGAFVLVYQDDESADARKPRVSARRRHRRPVPQRT
jgi:hypothetical protein